MLLNPVPLTELSSLDFTGSFGVNVTSAYNESSEDRRLQALDDEDVQYKIALDMFFDPNATEATASLPRYEVMIWLSYSYDV